MPDLAPRDDGESGLVTGMDHVNVLLGNRSYCVGLEGPFIS
jgi:hypothetical protein